jgi:hypothetical protein
VKRQTPKNLAASVRQRLLNRAQARGEDFGLVLPATESSVSYTAWHSRNTTTSSSSRVRFCSSYGRNDRIARPVILILKVGAKTALPG